jgi:endo-1,3-1,4-beta-glycanase ExoK
MASRTIALTSLYSLYSLLAVCGCSSSEGTSDNSGGRGSSAAAAGGAGVLQSGAGGGQEAGSSGQSVGGQSGTGAVAAGGAGAGQTGGTGAVGQVGGNAGSPSAGGSGQAGVNAGAGTGATAGAPGGSGGASGSGSNGPFVLAWQDDFDTLDSSAWELQTFTWDGNQATFSTQNASVADGVLTISLTAAPSGAEKPYLGVEMRSRKTLTYGKVSARMRFAKGSGVVSGLVLFYTPYPNCDWNEIDIEHLGKSSNTSQLNAMVYTGTPTPGCTTSVSPTQDPLIAELGFDAESDFHLYDIEWTPAGVKYFADGNLLRTWTANIARLVLPETILLTIWASSSADWAGALTSTSAPTSAQLDWIKVYDYAAPAAGM